MSSEPMERNLGTQPIARILEDCGLGARDLVGASTEQLTHKMVHRGCKGRRLTPNVQRKVCTALNRAAGTTYSIRDLFNY